MKAIPNQVSVPYRGATFLNQKKLFTAIITLAVSVPYRGATFLNVWESFAFFYFFVFPSPIGELHFSIFVKFAEPAFAVLLFPSPIGELHFSIREMGAQTKFSAKVSVPYRGATFLNKRTMEFNRRDRRVSVPYRGATFLNLINVLGVTKDTKVSVPYRGATFLNQPVVVFDTSFAWFPSPIGELHFSILLRKYCSNASLVVSVPYRGATFLNDMELFLMCRRQRFRPLSGSYISQYHLRKPASSLV